MTRACVARNGGQLTLSDRPPLLLADAGAQDDHVVNTRRELVFEPVEVFVALRQHERRTPVANSVDDVLADPPSCELSSSTSS